jgi:hemolysin activation/secretion protein
MDYASVYLLDPQGFPSNTRLWGTGLGIAAALGSHWQASFLFSLPLISTTVTPRNEPYFNFSMTAQF